MMEDSEKIPSLICFEHYQNPYRLSCLHSFCKDCIDRKCRNNDLFKCPICKSLTIVNCMDPDVRINTFFEFLKNSEGFCDISLTSCCFCDATISPKTAHLCKECEDILCLNCRLIHEKGRKTKSHTVISCYLNPVLHCKKHYEKLEYFCNEVECQKLVCSKCLPLFHANHRQCSVEEKTKFFCENISKNIEFVNLKLQEMNLYANLFESRKLELEAECKKIETAARETRDFIINNANELYNKVNTTLRKTKLETIDKINKNIAMLSTSQTKMSGLKNCTPLFLENLSLNDLKEMNSGVESLLENELYILYFDNKGFDYSNRNFKDEDKKALYEAICTSFDQLKLQIFVGDLIKLSNANTIR